MTIQIAANTSITPTFNGELKKLSQDKLHHELLQFIVKAGAPGSERVHSAQMNIFKWLCDQIMTDPFRVDTEGNATFSTLSLTILATRASRVGLNEFSNMTRELAYIVSTLLTKSNQYSPVSIAKSFARSEREYKARIVNRKWNDPVESPFSEISQPLIESSILLALQDRASNIKYLLQHSREAAARASFESLHAELSSNEVVWSVAKLLWPDFEKEVGFNITSVAIEAKKGT